ncbi:DEAD/DEAH box helicase [Nocardiopsis sp. N85]|uniref:DEAD/DEAH box helicase n=1 Tax=Nocardiopsis sp. N85 TaxID=3029400 RepID=UPI00237FC702|nr:DEAD/DEAH box helicase [Nocardiopsis sp. N85]MDE3724220.1 DEAD/DEAH box helicase [Nocardiopsis sp. N85]
MRVLHGVWDRDALVVWGEGEAPDGGRAGDRPHPFALGHRALRDLVPVPAGTVTLELRLPGTTAAPDRSTAPSPEPAAFHTWTVPGLRLAPAAAERWCATMPRDVGPSLRHLKAVHAFARTLVETGCVLPDLVGDPPRARWRPAPMTWAEEHLAALSAALPASARAHLPDAGPDTTARSCVLAPVELLTDALARRAARPTGHPAEAASPGALLAAALVDDDGAMDPEGAARLRPALRDWRARVRGAGRAALLFLLREPERGTPWTVEFWVRSVTDPGLRLPLEQVWSGEGAAWLPGDVGVTALADLRRAARHHPLVGRALGDLAPTRLLLNVEDAQRFVAEAAPRLTAAGFGVVLPELRKGPALGLRMTAEPARGRRGTGGVGPSDLVDVSFEAVLRGDPEGAADPLTEDELAELAELARLKRSLVRVRGRWTQMDPERVQAALEWIAERGRRMRPDEVVRAAVGAAGAPPIPVEEVVADGPLGALFDGGAAADRRPMGTPDGFKAQLRPYQDRGASWLRFLGDLGLGAVLADDMGLGKTVQLLALLTDARGRDTGPTLLVCPVSLVGNWRREAERFAPDLRVHVQHGPDRPHANALARLVGHCDLVVTTYGVVARDTDELAGLPWERVVCDEAQALKNHDTLQAKAVRSLPARTRIALTGTPVENDLGELWSIMDFANPGLLGSAASFQQAVAGEEGPDTARVRRMTGPFVLRRLKTDRSIIADLPEKVEMRTWCTLTPEQASLYKAVVDEMTERLREADERERKGLVLATMTRLKQVCNHPAQFLGDGSALAGRSGKLDRLESILGEAVAEGDRALCFTQYARFGDRLAPYLRSRLGVPVLWLHGGTPRADREEMTRRFQSMDGPAVFLLSLKAAGTGLNLTAANHVVHVDRWWNPAVEDQATDRAFRIGQRRDVQVRKMVCVGTVEERVDEMIERKSALARGAVTTGEEWLAGLSVEDLREVVRLSPEAVA